MTQYDAKTAASVTALARRIIMTNLCKEILGVQPMPSYADSIFTMEFMVTHEPKYKFSREWYVAEFDWVHQGEVLDWCAKQFGPHPQNLDAWSRWQNKYSEKIHFRDERDYIWFVLRWS